MNHFQRNSLPSRLAAMKPGESLCLDGVKITAARMAATRISARRGIPYEARLEGSERSEAGQRVVVYCGVTSERVFTDRNGVRRVVARRQVHSVTARAGLKPASERWYGFPLEELKAQVERGWRLVCAKRGLDPRWA
jgi:hypothetical protein